MNLFEIPGCTFIGYATINNGNAERHVPLFRPAPPQGQASINTLEGWNAAADKQNRRSFRSVYGRDPADDAELTRWIGTQL